MSVALLPHVTDLFRFFISLIHLGVFILRDARVNAMLHHYGYSTTLSHFLNYHQVDEQSETEQTSSNSLYEDLGGRCKSSTEVNGKSFTIAAILGLKSNADGHQDVQSSATDLSVVNLSIQDRGLVSNCNRLQLPGRHGSAPVAGHYSVGHGCNPRQTGKPPGRVSGCFTTVPSCN